MELATALAGELAALAAAGCPVVVGRGAGGGDGGRGRRPRGRAFLRGAPRGCSRTPRGCTRCSRSPAARPARPAPRPIFGAPYASYLFDLIAGPDNWYLVRAAPGERGIVCAALAARRRRGERRATRRRSSSWAAHYAAASNGRGLERVGIANATPLGGLDPAAAHAALAALGRAPRARRAPAATRPSTHGLDPRAIVATAGRTPAAGPPAAGPAHAAATRSETGLQPSRDPATIGLPRAPDMAAVGPGSPRLATRRHAAAHRPDHCREGGRTRWPSCTSRSR